MDSKRHSPRSLLDDDLLGCWQPWQPGELPHGEFQLVLGIMQGIVLRHVPEACPEACPEALS